MTSALKGRQRSPAYYLWVEGVPTLYGSVTPPARTYETSAGAVPYALGANIIPGLGLRFERSLDVREHIIDARPVSVTLGPSPAFSPAPEPVAVFGRLGYRGQPWSLRLDAGQSVYQSQPEPITVTTEADPSAHISPGDVVHIAREAFEVVTVDGPTRAVKFIRRGLLGTLPSTHRYDPLTDVRPIITPGPAFFRGRRAVIYESDTVAGGGWFERWRGFVEDEPTIGADGQPAAVSLSIAPLTSELDRPLGGKSDPARLSATHHTFGGFAPRPRAASFVDMLEEVAAGGRFRSLSNMHQHAQYFAGLSYVPVIEGDLSAHQDVSDLTLPVGHPRRCQVTVANVGTVHEVTGHAVGVDTGTFVPPDPDPTTTSALEVAPAPSVDAGNGAPLAFGRVESVASAEWRSVSMMAGAIGPECHPWPARLVERWNAPSGLRSLTPSGVNGGYSRAEIDEAGAVTVSRTGDQVPGAIRVTFTSEQHHRQRRAGAGQPGWAGGDWRHGGCERVHPADRMPGEVLPLDDGDAPRVLTLEPGEASTQGFHLDTPQAWYSAGERWITLDREVSVPSSGVLHLEARQGGDLLGTFSVTSCTAQAFGAQVVYICELQSDIDAGTGGRFLKTMTQRAGGDPIELTPVAAFEGRPVADVLLRLLCSSGGHSVSSLAHDRLGTGAALTDGTVPGRAERGQDVDRESFEGVQDPIGGVEFAPVWRDGDTVLDVVGGLLRACGYLLDLRTDDAGRCMLAAVPLGLPIESDVRESITTREITSSAPASSTEAEIFNRYTFESNYDDEGKPQKSQAVRDQASIDAFGEEAEMRVPLPGVNLSGDVDIVAQLRPIFSRLRLLFAHPRRLFSFGTLHGVGVTAQVGGTYRVSHPLLVGEAGGLGVDSALCSLRSVSVDGWSGVTRVEMVSHGREGSGWAPSLDVVAVIDATTLAVAERMHSRQEDPATGAELIDLDGFTGLAPGDSVHVYPAGGMDGGQDIGVSSIDRAARTITLSAPHGIAAGAGTLGHIVPVEWEPPSEHRAYAHIGRVEVI